jgi:hypothetical protein
MFSSSSGGTSDAAARTRVAGLQPLQHQLERLRSAAGARQHAGAAGWRRPAQEAGAGDDLQRGERARVAHAGRAGPLQRLSTGSQDSSLSPAPARRPRPATPRWPAGPAGPAHAEQADAGAAVAERLRAAPAGTHSRPRRAPTARVRLPPARRARARRVRDAPPRPRARRGSACSRRTELEFLAISRARVTVSAKHGPQPTAAAAVHGRREGRETSAGHVTSSSNRSAETRADPHGHQVDRAQRDRHAPRRSPPPGAAAERLELEDGHQPCGIDEGAHQACRLVVAGEDGRCVTSRRHPRVPGRRFPPHRARGSSTSTSSRAVPSLCSRSRAVAPAVRGRRRACRSRCRGRTRRPSSPPRRPATAAGRRPAARASRGRGSRSGTGTAAASRRPRHQNGTPYQACTRVPSSRVRPLH